ncbi:MAG: DUF1318 domain-containing protein [Deltaproteobacteria bacterium]|nr:DUF1318 domain-containing protein [Deltaproteobacteria bacterium]
MKTAGKTLAALVLCAALFVFACVTINIYFPAEKVESVAGDIVKDIRGDQNRGQGKEKDDRSSLLWGIASAISPSRAWAEEATTVSNPTIRALKEKMKANFAQMKPYYDRGMLSEGADGYVSVGNIGSLGLKEKRDIKALVDAENQNRRTLYAEVAKALNIDPSQVDRIGQIFAKEWQKSVR